MDRNREARRAAAMANGLPRRRHRTTGGTLRDSPEGDGPPELQDMAARLRDRTAKKDRDREMRERDRDRDKDREKDRDRLNRSKRRRGDKYMHGSTREDGAGGGDDSSEESVNDEDEEDDEGPAVPPSIPVSMSPASVASALTSHRKSYPPPFKVFRVAPSWKAPDEMIGFSVPRKARSASTKRGHDCWSSAGGGGGGNGEMIHRQASSSPVRSTMTAAAAAVGTVPSPLPAPPASPPSSNVSIKKKIANGPKQRPPKSSSKSSPSFQDEIEIEVAEVLYGLMRQSQGPAKQEGLSNDSAQLDSKSIVSSPIPNNNNNNNNTCSSSSAPPLTTVAPKRKRPRPYPDEIPGGLGPRSSPASLVPKTEADQAPKLETRPLSTEKNLGSAIENGSDFGNSHDPPPVAPLSMSNNGILSDAKLPLAEGSTEGRNGMLITKAEEASSSPPNHDLVESFTTSTKTNSALAGSENLKEKFEIDLMAPPPQSRTSPEREEKVVEYGGEGSDEKSMVTDREAEAKSSTEPNKEEDEKEVKSSSGVELNAAAAAEEAKASSETHKQQQQEQHQQQLNLNGKERDGNIDPQLDLEKSSVNDSKLNLQKQLTPPPKPTKDDAYTDKPGDQSGSVPLPMSVPGGWHGGLPPMGYVGPLQGVVSIDGTTVASPPIQPPHFLFSQPRSKRCATHCYIARSISIHQQMMKVNPFWPAAAAAAAAAAGTAPLFGAKPYNLNMVPSADLHAGVRGVVDSAQDNRTQPFALFPGQPASSSKDKSPLIPNVTEAAQKKQFLLQPAVPPEVTAGNILHAPALFFPMGQQQAAANVRPSSAKFPSMAGTAASTNTSTSASMGASTVGPAMSFSYPNMGGNETQFMAILGNSPYPFPIPTHVGAAAPPYRGSHPQAMPFFNGSFYSSQVLHLQQQRPNQQQNQLNASISTTSSSQKHLQGQQQRPHGSSATAAGNPSPASQNFQVTKGRTSQTQQDMGGEDSPSTADSRAWQNLSVYGQNFAMPFQSPNFALTTLPSSNGGGGNNATGGANGNHGEKQQLQQSQHTPAFPMSFATINGATAPGLDVSSMAHNHQITAAAAAAQAAQQKKNNYRGTEDGKTGSGATTDPSNVDEERKASAARASVASVGQSIAFSRDLAETSLSTMPGNSVVDSSARSLNLMPGSARANHSSGPNDGTNSKASNSQPQQQPQQHQQMLFSKQQQFVASAATTRGKTPTTSNVNIYPDHLTPSSVMGAKFPNALSGFPPLVQTSSTSTQTLQWKNSVRPNTSQVSSPSVAISTASNIKNLPQQQGGPQQNHTQISFGAPGANPKSSTISQGQQTQTSNLAPSSPMMVGSPSASSMSKSAGGSPRATASASTGSKAGVQASSLSSQQGKNSLSQSLTSQKPSILGNPHMMSTSSSASKLQMQHSQQQPQFSKQSIQQAQLFFSNASTAMPGAGYYLQRPKPENQQQQQGPKPQGAASTTPSSGMLSLCAPVSLASTSTSDPAKAVAAAAAAASSMKGGLPAQGIFHAAQFAAQSAGGAHQLMPAGFPYIHAVSAAVQVKPADEQKQPAGE